jgi:hypothetical protein
MIYNILKDEFSNFCINQNLKQAIFDSVDLLKAGHTIVLKTRLIKHLKIGIDSDLGLRLHY